MILHCLYVQGKIVPRDCPTCNHRGDDKLCHHPLAPKTHPKIQPKMQQAPHGDADALVDGVKDLEKRHIEY